MKRIRIILVYILITSAMAFGQYVVNFEGASETKTAYGSGSVTLSGLEWNMTEVLIGTDASDYKSGVRSARLRGYGTSIMSMLADKSNGAGTISFKYRRYGTDAQVDWKVEYSTDAGANWTQAGSSFTAPAGDTVTFSQAVNVSGNIRMRIKRATETGTANRRLNIDDITITDYTPGGTPAIVVNPISLSGFSYLTGAGPSASKSYSLSGSDLSPSADSIRVTASSNYEISLNNSTFSSSLKVPYTGGALSATTIYVRLIAGLGIGSYSGTISDTGGGVSSAVNVSLSGSVYKPEPTNHPAAFDATLGSPSFSAVVLTWTDATAGTAPDGYLIKGSSVSYSAITSPVDTLPETNGTLIRNVTQGTQTYTFTGLSGSTTYYFKIYPYTNSGTGINYKTDGTVQQDSAITTETIIPAITGVLVPQYMQGLNGTNSTRVPYAFRATLTNLNPGATYRFINQVVNYSDGATTSGAGNVIFVNSDSTFTRSSGPSFSTSGNYGEFTTNGAGSYTGWFITEPSGNARFTPGSYVSLRIRLNDGAGGTSVATYLTISDSVKVINFGSSNDPAQGSGIYGRSLATAKEFVFLYDNTDGTGRPVAGTVVESDGVANTVTNSYVSFYADSVNGISGAWGTIIPNQLANGIRRIERRSLSTGSVFPAVATDADGIWSGGANTVNPTGGSSTPLVITSTDAPLSGFTLNLTAFIEGLFNQGNNTMIADTVTVEIRNASGPYGLVESKKVLSNSTGVSTPLFTTVSNGTNYYIAIRHRNAIETWSKNPLQFTGGTLTYDFTTAADKAYGDNLIQKGTKYCLYSGDVNQDGQVSLDDLLAIDSDNQNFVTGYTTTDVNGDDQVTLDDLLITDANNQNFVSKQSPAGFVAKKVPMTEEGGKLIKKIEDYKKSLEQK